MSFAWVSKIQLLDDIIQQLDFGAMSVSYTGSSPILIGGSGAGEAQGITESAFLTGSNFADNNAWPNGTYAFIGYRGGIIRLTKSGGTTKSFILEICDNNLNVLAYTSFSANIPYYPKVNLMCTLDAENQVLYFGFALYNRNEGVQYARVATTIIPTNVYNTFVRSLPVPSSDPYSDGGYSTGTDTGTGTFDDTSESVPLPTTYALSATASGIMSQYVLTEANLAAFGSWLWNGGTIVDDLKHFFQSPMEAIFSVGILPFTPSDTTPYNVYVGALAATGVQGGLVGDTVEKISCGSITFDGYYGGALDYNPYTKIELFLPYCGTLSLNADEVMGHTISVDYYCDTITGDCVAFVSDEERVLHQVRGNCFIQIPLAARDFTALYSSAIAAIGTIAAGLATAASGGLSAPVAVGMGSSMAANAMNAKTHIARAGGVSGMAGFMSIQTPYVIMSIPNQCLPEFQNDFQGYPLFVTKRLGDFSGFTKVYEIHLDGLDCTDAEAKEIYELLKGGVVL